MMRWILIAIVILAAAAVPQFMNPNGYWIRVFTLTLLFAGMGDIHIHAREDVSQKNCYKEDFLSARAAARNGGLCHCGDMPNNPVPPVNDETYGAKLRLAEKAGGEIWIYAGIGPGTSPLSWPVAMRPDATTCDRPRSQSIMP